MDRLDALDLAFFERELRAVDTRAFEEKLAALKARQLIPSIGGIAEGMNSYEYHMFKFIGRAKYAGRAGSTDAPRGEVTGSKSFQAIEPIIDGYGYSIWEIQAASAANRPLDAMRAIAARRALEQLIDESWAWGAADLGLKGLLTLTNSADGVLEFAGSGTWGDLDTADPEKVYADLVGICSAAMENSEGVFDRFRVVLPNAQYNVAAQLRFGQGSDMTVLKAALMNCSYLESVTPWFRCSEDATGSPLARDVMVAYPGDEMVLGGIARDVNFLDAQPMGFRYEVPAHAATGGIVCRYPVAVAVCDDTGAA